jgi:hypothetical protein
MVRIERSVDRIGRRFAARARDRKHSASETQGGGGSKPHARWMMRRRRRIFRLI